MLQSTLQHHRHQLGIKASKTEIKEIFQKSAADKRGKGSSNNYEAWKYDARYSEGQALQIEDFAERVTGRATERDQTKGTSLT
jgi:hypothetical protein